MVRKRVEEKFGYISGQKPVVAGGEERRKAGAAGEKEGARRRYLHRVPFSCGSQVPPSFVSRHHISD